MAPIKLTIEPNIDEPFVTFRDEEGTWYMLAPEDMAEVKRLLSDVHIVHHYFPETQTK